MSVHERTLQIDLFLSLSFRFCLGQSLYTSQLIKPVTRAAAHERNTRHAQANLATRCLQCCLPQANVAASRNLYCRRPKQGTHGQRQFLHPLHARPRCRHTLAGKACWQRMSSRMLKQQVIAVMQVISQFLHLLGMWLKNGIASRGLARTFRQSISRKLKQEITRMWMASTICQISSSRMRSISMWLKHKIARGRLTRTFRQLISRKFKQEIPRRWMATSIRQSSNRIPRSSQRKKEEKKASCGCSTG